MGRVWEAGRVLARRLPSRWPWAQAARLSASEVGLVLVWGVLALTMSHYLWGAFFAGLGWITAVWSVAGVLALRERRAVAQTGRPRC